MLVCDADSANNDLNGWIMDTLVYYPLSKLYQTVQDVFAEILYLILFWPELTLNLSNITF